jgi:7-cyano-7-deazaguanine reductase
MTQLGETSNQARNTIEEHAGRDLSALLETEVHVAIFDPGSIQDYNKLKPYFESNYVTLEDLVDSDSWLFTQYTEEPKLLTGNEFITSQDYLVRQEYHSSLLKSNCRVTHQPDWGDVFIAMKSKKVIKPENLLSYIVSFRDENHFHEEICETIYTRLWSIFRPAQLAVTCLYARRGGIDINPTRVSHVDLLTNELIDINVPFCKTSRQ